ncbi:unnamed protein product [Rhizoctonia solani]|uniref:Uncharacterized protein n=1 Tax=Rhizoctonia solani TaxID=456999 RepID=A0A8H3BVU0_9AGAM|nr:unnamed protein product [Rhizoctonia solani]
MQEGPCEHYSYAYFHHSVPRCAPLATPFAIGLSLFNPGSIGTIHFTLLAMPQLVSHFSALPPNLQLGPQPIRSNYSTVAANRLAATGFTASPDDLISPLAVRVVTCLLFFRNRIISASDDHQIHVYSPTSGELLLRLEGHEGGVWALAVSPNSPSAPHATDSLVSGSTDRTVRIWDLSTGKCTHVFGGHTSTVRCLAIVKPMWIDVDGRKEKWPKRTLIVTGSRDHTLSVWKLPRHGDIDAWARMAKIWIQPRQVDSLFEHEVPLSEHTHAVRALAARGRTLIPGSYDTTVRVWVTGECKWTLDGHSQKVYSVVLDPQRNQAMSGTMDGTVRIWSLATGQALHTLTGHSSLVGLLGLSPTPSGSTAAMTVRRRAGLLGRVTVRDGTRHWVLIRILGDYRLLIDSACFHRLHTMDYTPNIDELLFRAKRRYIRRFYDIERHHRIATLMARHRIELQQEQYPASAAQLEIRLAHQLLDIHERTVKKRERNLSVFLLRIEEIHAGRLTYLIYL